MTLVQMRAIWGIAWLNKYTGTRFEEFCDAVEALVAEPDIADGEDLVDEQDIRFHLGSDGEAEADFHAGGVVLDRHVQEVADIGEVDDGIEFLQGILFGKSEQ